MCDLPVMLASNSCEETIVSKSAQLMDAAGHCFLEALLVAHFIYEGIGRDEQPLTPTQV